MPIRWKGQQWRKRKHGDVSIGTLAGRTLVPDVLRVKLRYADYGNWATSGSTANAIPSGSRVDFSGNNPSNVNGASEGPHFLDQLSVFYEYGVTLGAKISFTGYAISNPNDAIPNGAPPHGILAIVPYSNNLGSTLYTATQVNAAMATRSIYENAVPYMRWMLIEPTGFSTVGMLYPAKKFRIKHFLATRTAYPGMFGGADTASDPSDFRILITGAAASNPTLSWNFRLQTYWDSASTTNATYYLEGVVTVKYYMYLYGLRPISPSA